MATLSAPETLQETPQETPQETLQETSSRNPTGHPMGHPHPAGDLRVRQVQQQLSNMAIGLNRPSSCLVQDLAAGLGSLSLKPDEMDALIAQLRSARVAPVAGPFPASNPPSHDSDSRSNSRSNSNYQSSGSENEGSSDMDFSVKSYKEQSEQQMSEANLRRTWTTDSQSSLSTAAEQARAATQPLLSTATTTTAPAASGGGAALLNVQHHSRSGSRGAEALQRGAPVDSSSTSSNSCMSFRAFSPNRQKRRAVFGQSPNFAYLSQTNTEAESPSNASLVQRQEQPRQEQPRQQESAPSSRPTFRRLSCSRQTPEEDDNDAGLINRNQNLQQLQQPVWNPSFSGDNVSSLKRSASPLPSTRRSQPPSPRPGLQEDEEHADASSRRPPSARAERNPTPKRTPQRIAKDEAGAQQLQAPRTFSHSPARPASASASTPPTVLPSSIPTVRTVNSQASMTSASTTASTTTPFHVAPTNATNAQDGTAGTPMDFSPHMTSPTPIPTMLQPPRVVAAPPHATPVAERQQPPSAVPLKAPPPLQPRRTRSPGSTPAPDRSKKLADMDTPATPVLDYFDQHKPFAVGQGGGGGGARRRRMERTRTKTQRVDAIPFLPDAGAPITGAPFHNGGGGASTTPTSDAAVVSTPRAPSPMQVDEVEAHNFTPGRTKPRFRLPNKTKMEAPLPAADAAPPAHTLPTAAPQPASPDYSGLFSMVQGKRDEAAASYMRKDYKTSIACYTWAIQALASIQDKPIFERDTMAVLLSNRAAALLMLGAYSASADDCRQGLAYVSDGGSRGECFSKDAGPPLRVRLLARFGKALLKQGSDKEASSAFDTAIQVSQEASVFTTSCHSPVEAQQNVVILNQIETEARICRREVRHYQEFLEQLRQSNQRANASGDRWAWAEPLGHVKSALSFATGSDDLMHSKLMLLSKMKRWREAAGVLERLAAMNVRMDGAFVGDLVNKNPFPGIPVANFLSADFFHRAREEDASTAHKKLNSKSVGEGVLRMPYAMTSIYVRALRLEERYPAADTALNALDSFTRKAPRHVKAQFTWISKERTKLENTRAGREKGDELFKEGKFEKASKEYAKSLSIDGSIDGEGVDTADGSNSNEGGRLHAVLHCNRAACMMALKQYEGALAQCTAALRIHPRYMKAILRRARCYARLARFAEAISEFKRWLELAEEANTGSVSANDRVTPCLFDGPQDVKEQDVLLVRKELGEVALFKRRAESAAREEASRNNHDRQRWNDTFASAQSAQQRRDQWYNQKEEPRRWDSFRNRGPRQNSRRSSSAEPGVGNDRGKSSPRSQSSERTHRRQQSVGSASPGSLDKLDHYTVLQVSVHATGEQIKKAYRKMALKYHPDKNKKEGADIIFHRINLAHEILSDPIERRKYDVERYQVRG